ncbi:MAG: YbjN domain-containing protein [Rhodobacteraceae bacterium]|nr:YbjN domain-containing protein [Paracoccaceae bacterium]MCY4196651.1 YbjN domain-containing protein [Paracoccaceae bacterium]MCY4326723.1 YbjN domain-containing protein [Paracoccaceae bacterium]
MYQAGFEAEKDLVHPVDLAQAVAIESGWPFRRDEEDQLLIEYEGNWRIYSLSVSLLEDMEILLVRAGFSFKLNEDNSAPVLQVVNYANQICPVGAFTLHCSEESMVFGTGQTITGEGHLTSQQLTRLIEICIAQCERFYPAFQAAILGVGDVQSAIEAAVLEPIGEC